MRGQLRLYRKGVKDCSNCLVPHGRKSYSYIVDKFPMLAELARKKD